MMILLGAVFEGRGHHAISCAGKAHGERRHCVYGTQCLSKKKTANFIYLFLINFYCSILDLQFCVFIYSFGKHVVQGQKIFRNRSVYN